MQPGERFRQLTRRLGSFVPSQCAICRGWPEARICSACVSRFAQPAARCSRCALRLAPGTLQCADCLKAPNPLDACVAAVSYEYPWIDLIADFKFRSQPGLAPIVCTLMHSMPHVDPLLEAADGVMPIPLSGPRLSERGFNQSHLLAKTLAPGKVMAQALLRVNQQSVQSQQNREERLASMRHAFVIDPAMYGAIAGQHIALIDDVMTTGATLYAAAHVLRSAGAARITALVFARTEREP